MYSDGVDLVVYVIVVNDWGFVVDRNRVLVGDFVVLVVGLICCWVFDFICRLWVVWFFMKVFGWDFLLFVIIVICGVGVEFGIVWVKVVVVMDYFIRGLLVGVGEFYWVEWLVGEFGFGFVFFWLYFYFGLYLFWFILVGGIVGCFFL